MTILRLLTCWLVGHRWRPFMWHASASSWICPRCGAVSGVYGRRD